MQSHILSNETQQLFNISHPIALKYAQLPNVSFEFTADQVESATYSVWTGPNASVGDNMILDPIGKQIGKLSVTPSELLTDDDDNAISTENIPCEIKIRGSSSAGFRKKQYRLETQKEDGEQTYDGEDFHILGMPKEEDWILQAPYSDKTYMRNALAYTLGRMAMDAFNVDYLAPRFKYCTLNFTVPGASLLGPRGLYLFMEKIKRDKNRINIKKNEEEDPILDQVSSVETRIAGAKGSFILKFDRLENGTMLEAPSNEDDTKPEYFTVDYADGSLNIAYEYPKVKDLHTKTVYTVDGLGDTTKEKVDVVYDATDLQSYFRNICEAAPYDPDNENGSTATGIDQLVDIDSFAHYVIIQEISRNVDAYRLSTYMYKDEDDGEIPGKLKFVLWDFNLGFGNENVSDIPTDETSRPHYKGFVLSDTRDAEHGEVFFNLIYSKCKEYVINTFRNSGMYSYESIKNVISQQMVHTLTGNAVQQDQEIWGTFDHEVWPNPRWTNPDASYKVEVDHMLAWIQNRLNWLNENWTL